MITRGTFDVTWTDDFPLDQKALKKYLVILNSVFALIGIITAIISMIYPWVALGICGLVILNSINPVGSMARMIRQSVKTK
jgi:hypothetical protein